MSFSTDLHMRLLLSLDRGHNLQRAVAEAVRPGSRVLDAGTGSGILSFMALRAGASHVVAVDRQHVDVARALAEHNGLVDRITFAETDLMDLDIPGVDVTKTFDVLLSFIYTNHPLVDEARSRMVFALRDRYGAPDCAVVPGVIRYQVTGCERRDWDLHTESTDLRYAVDLLNGCYGLDFAPLVELTRRELAIKRSRPIDPTSRDWRPPTRMACIRFDREDVRLLSEPQPFVEVDYTADAFTPFPTELTLQAVSPGRLSGVIWTQELAHAGRPLWTTETFSPLGEQVQVNVGDTVLLEAGEQWRATNILGVREVKPATSFGR
ncbi:class I SAM-dependent methyltransferase [Micromonospora sp. NPDC023814]|uniref:class I SAM-dependent methyltransferase n=1 Tax=Micromonospora sp. NPDC023814 TaxID=3154596 RepID=UPI0033FEF6D0